MDKGSNATFISLIHKKEEAALIKDFRPIGLISSSYKIISKIVVDQMEVVLDLDSVISHNQSAFIGGRQSLDGVLIANESIDSVLKKGETRILCKLDLEKNV